MVCTGGTEIPALPDIRDIPRTLSALKEITQIREGIIGQTAADGSYPDRFVSFRCLEDAILNSSTIGAALASGVKLPDLDASNYLRFVWNENDTNDRNLNITLDGADRDLALHASLTVESTSIVNQDLTTDASPTFASLYVPQIYGSDTTAQTLTLTDNIIDGNSITIGSTISVNNRFRVDSGGVNNVATFVSTDSIATIAIVDPTDVGYIGTQSGSFFFGQSNSLAGGSNIIVNSAGNVLIDNKLIHNGDENTYLEFTDDMVSITAGAVEGLRVTESAGAISILGNGTLTLSDLLTINQSADSDGIQINGYDDRSSNYLQLNVDAAGQGNLTSLGAALFRSVNGIFKLISGSGQSQYFDAGGYFFWRDVDDSDATKMSLNSSDGTLALNGRMNINQVADGAGLTLNGYDDKSADNLNINIASDGQAIIDATSGVKYRVGIVDKIQIGANYTNAFQALRFSDNIPAIFGGGRDYSWVYSSVNDVIQLVDGEYADTNVLMSMASTGELDLNGRMDINQVAHSQGLRIYGYDSQSAEYFSMYTASDGTSNFDSTSHLIFGAGSNKNIYADFGGVFYWRDKDDTDAVRMQLDSATGALNLTLASASAVGLTLKGFASQTADIINLTDDSDASVLQVRAGGNILSNDGMITTSAQYGSAYWSWVHGDDTPAHVGGTGSYDHTGGAQEKLFTKTGGDDFTGADLGRWILLTGTNIGAVAEIKTIIGVTQVIVDGMGWDGDLASQSFNVFEHPAFVTGDGYKHEFSVNSSGEFEIYSYGFTGRYMSEIKLDSAAVDTHALLIEGEANGYSDVILQEINYISGALQPGDVGANQLIQIDDSLAVAADATTQIAGSVYITTNASDATKDAIVVLPGFTRALDVFGAEAEDPGFGYETTSGTSVDRVNSGGGGNDAFKNAAVNVELFDSSGDDILIGSASTFEIIQVIFAIVSAKNLDFDFWYSQAGGNWTAFVPQADNTNGFLNNGNIVFSAAALTGWSKDDEDLDGNAITDAYYIALTRTYNPTVSTLPTESYFKTFSSQATGMFIDGQGFISPRVAADTDAPNNTIYESTDQGVLVYKDSGGTVNDLY